MNPSLSNPTVQSPKTAETIQTWFVDQIAEQLGVDPDDIDTHETFEHYSLDSAQALAIAGRAEKFLGFQLSPTLLWHYPTIAALAGRLAEETVAEADMLNQLDATTLAQALEAIEQD
jgi:acyl carrier protein